MVASQVIARAMSMADLQNSQFITYQDQQNSIFEAYKDLFSSITANDDDFFINTVTFTTVGATTPSPGEYLFPLPSGFYKVRTVEYQAGNYWIPMERFSMAARGTPTSVPRYRFQGNNLWVIGWLYPGFTGSYQLRVHYYPLPVQPTFPDLPLSFGSAITASLLNSITSPFFANILTYNGNAMVSNRNYFYCASGTDIWNESIDSRTTANLYTGTAVSNIQYYKGYVYYLDSGTIYRATFTPGDLTIAPSALTITGSPTVVNFNIFANTIYYSTSSETYSVALSGGTPTSLSLGKTTTYNPLVSGGYFCYINSSGALVVNGVSLGGNYANCATDNNTNIYTVNTSGDLELNVLDITDPAAPTITTSLVESDVAQMGNCYFASNSNVGAILAPFSPILSIAGNETPRFQGISGVYDTDFAYPLNSNETGEIMAVQCAIDFRSKQDQNADALRLRKQELMVRLFETMRRDDYKMERVSNVYGNRGGPMGQGFW